MLIKQINEDGEEVEIEVFTQEEANAIAAQKAEEEKARLQEDFEKQLAEKDEHLKKKTDEFVQAKQGMKGKEEGLTEKEQLLEEKIAEATRIAQEAVSQVELAKTQKNDSIKNMLIESLVGGDEDLKKKLSEAYDLVSIPIEAEGDIQRRMSFAAGAIGISASAMPQVSFSSGTATPTVAPADKKRADAEYDEWRKSMGLPDLTK